MPEINQIPEVLYQGDQPYHVHYDNLPLINILKRIDLVNAQVDINSDVLRGAAGNSGSLANRLNVSLEEDGSLKTSAVDDALHNIGAHIDGSYAGEDYVRMLLSERNKLNLIEAGANNLTIEIEDAIPNLSGISISSTPYNVRSIKFGPDIIDFNTGKLKFRGSDTIFWDFESPDIIKAHSVFPSESAHIHNYNLTPAHQTPSSPDYKNFKTTSLSTPFAEESLRVYVNGFRIPYDVSISIRDDNGVWSDIYIETFSPETGEFSLNRAILSTDIITIDFDQSL